MSSEDSSVHVLLLSWEDTEPDHAQSLEELREVFWFDFDYETSWFRIPDQEPQEKLETKISEFLRLRGKKGNLLILCYAGHGGSDNGRLIWGP